MARLFHTYTPVYYWIRDSPKRIKILQGGSSSSKTISILQLIILKLIQNPGWVATVCAETTKSIQKGALRDFKTLMLKSSLLKHSLLDPTLVEGPYIFRNGSILEFDSVKDAGEARHGKRQILFINEVNYVSYEAMLQLLARSEDIYFDFNSDSRFWVHKEFQFRPDVDFFISNYTHNPYAKESMIGEILNYKTQWLATGKKYWKNKWLVYGLGLTGVSEGAIFEHVEYVRSLPLNLRNRAYIIDFGFQIDPTAVAVAGEIGNSLYGKELYYAPKTNTQELIKKFPSFGITKSDLIIADNANPDAISQMQAKGWNVIPCSKKGGIEARIKALLERDIYLTMDSDNWMQEQENYKYKTVASELTDEPIDAWNHLWDCLGYWYSHFHPAIVREQKKGRRRFRTA
jgi:phage terminase large subunit